ncbi:MAG: alpha/beta hydrolase [Candidatus Yonathbacteria bacterium]|nr:alpha/beta hydrolase [Candidatus Yonathbacteria bacterium]
MKEFFFSERGIYYRTNEFHADRKTLVFVHGLSGSSSAWVEYEKRFEGEYNILSFDLRGHGKSMKPKNYEDYEIKKFTDDFQELIADLHLEKFILLSHSFGTLIALDFLLTHQDKLEAAIFLSPTFFVRKRTLARAIEPFLKFVQIFDPLPFSGKAGGHVDYSKYKNTGDWNIPRMIADIGNTSMRVYLYCTKQSYEFDREDALRQIVIPVLMIHGKNDTIFPQKISALMAKKIKNSTFILLDDTDHIIVLNNVAEISKAIEGFVKKTVN